MLSCSADACIIDFLTYPGFQIVSSHYCSCDSEHLKRTKQDGMCTGGRNALTNEPREIQISILFQILIKASQGRERWDDLEDRPALHAALKRSYRLICARTRMAACTRSTQKI